MNRQDSKAFVAGLIVVTLTLMALAVFALMAGTGMLMTA